MGGQTSVTGGSVKIVAGGSKLSEYALAPKTKADYAFLLHDLDHLKPDGIMAIVLPHGVLFRGGEEGAIRKNLIEGNHIDTIIGLPANIFFGTGIPTTILILKQRRENTDVLIVDASKGFIKVGKNNKLRASDVKRIVDTVTQRLPKPKYAKVVEKATIRENDYNLNIPRYVDSSEDAESWDIYSSMFGGIPEKEIETLGEYWKAFPNLRAALFSSTSAAYAKLNVDAVKNAIKEQADVKTFVANFNTAFDDLATFLQQELLTNMMDIRVAQEETILSADIFKRLKKLPLIDKYEAYQLLDDEWTKIATDLEIIHTEGFATTKIVDPNMVIKKKKGKDVEVQEGWKGRIMPFELVQKTYLKAELENLKQKENRLVEITSTYEEILDSLSEEEKEAETVNEAKDSFINAVVTKEAKQLKAEIKKNGAFVEDSYETKIIRVSELLTEEKALKKRVKSETAALHLLTKATIEKLTNEQVYELLRLKWISPLVTSLYKLPEVIVNELTTKVDALAEKYATTYSAVVEQIQEAEDSLSILIDDLVGNEFDTKGLNEFKSLLKKN